MDLAQKIPRINIRSRALVRENRALKNEVSILKSAISEMPPAPMVLYSKEEVMTMHGITQAELDAMDEVELE